MTRNNSLNMNTVPVPSAWGGTGLPGTGLITFPAVSQSSSLSLGAAYQNTFGYDIVLTVYLGVTVAVGAAILCGVGPVNSPSEQTIINSLTVSVLLIVPVTMYVPKDYYALISKTGTITYSIVGQQAFPV